MKDLKNACRRINTQENRRTFKSPPLYTGVGNMSDILYRKQKKYYFLLVLPALCIYTFCAGRTVIFGTIPNSFFSWNLIKGTHNWIGIKNFVDLVHDRDFIQSMFLTFKLAVVTIVLTNVLAFFIALALNTHIFGKPVIRAFFFIPNIISGVMIALAWTFIFQKVTANNWRTFSIRKQ